MKKKVFVLTLVILALLILWALFLSGGKLQDFIPLANENHWQLIQWTLDSF